MRGLVLSAVSILCCAVFANSQTSNPPSASELSEIAARGKAIAEHDVAAWHASDALAELKPEMRGVERYLARKTTNGWVVAWGGFDQSRSKFLVFYEAKQGATPEAFTVEKHDPPLEDADYYLRAAKAEEVALKKFFETNRPYKYNVTVLPQPSGAWYVYLIPAQTKTDVLPFGGDVRYEVSSDGEKILNTRQMHKTVKEDTLHSSLTFGYHTHILSDTPEDTDIFYASTRKAKQGEWIITRDYSYEITPTGTISYLGKTKSVTENLEKNKCNAFRSTIDLCRPEENLTRVAVTSLAANLETGIRSEPLDAVPSLVGADCRNGTLFAKFEIWFHNFGNTPILLHRDTGTNWVQARFGQTASRVHAGKYEKLVYFNNGGADVSKPESFVVLLPDSNYTVHSSFPIIGLDVSDKPVMQFLFYSWPPTHEKEANKYKEQWATTGTLYTEALVTGTFPAIVDPKLIESCKAK